METIYKCAICESLNKISKKEESGIILTNCSHCDSLLMLEEFWSQKPTERLKTAFLYKPGSTPKKLTDPPKPVKTPATKITISSSNVSKHKDTKNDHDKMANLAHKYRKEGNHKLANHYANKAMELRKG